MNMHKLLLPVVVALPLCAVTFFESCLTDGEDTVIIDAPPSKDTVSHQPSVPDTVPVPEPDTELEVVDINELQGKSGDLRFNLQWHTEDDVDLLVVTPCEDTIYFNNRVSICHGAAGSLDVDANFDIFPEHPQENIYWEKPYPGEYKAFVHNYSFYHNPTHDVDFILTVINHGERTDIKGRTDESYLVLVSSINIEP